MSNNDDLKPFGYIPGPYDMLCKKCGHTWALMGILATSCKGCAKNALRAATLEIDADIRLNQDREITLDDLLEK